MSGPLPVLPHQQTSASITINMSNVSGTLDVKKNVMMGCHTDLGYAHQIHGFYSQKLYGESFENYTGQGPDAPLDVGNMWTHVGKGSWSLTTDAPLHGLVAQRIRGIALGAGVANRGFNQEGISLSGGKPYEGYVFARSQTPLALRVALEDYFSSPPTVLAESVLEFAGGNWTQMVFNLTPSADTSCRGFPADTPPLNCKLGNMSGKGDSAHACLQCSGQLSITVETVGVTLDLDYAFLQAGEWGRFKGLPLNKDSVTWLQRGGYSMIRTGGTYVEADSDEWPDPKNPGVPTGNHVRNGYLWKKQRGPPWLRPGTVWNHDGMNGVMTTRGWSMFEAIEMCEKMGIEAVITLNSNETYGDLGDLVEYLYAPVGARSQWGNLRAQDGHPEPYNISWFEIGNEINTSDFAGRALAMETRAKSIGMDGVLRYACPAQCGDDAVINASFTGSPPLGERVYWDVHAIGGPKVAMNTVANFKKAGSKARVVIWETNTARHDFSRVIVEGSDLNDLHRAGSANEARIDSRVQSFCMEKSGHNPGLDLKHGFLGDQGSLFFTPNQTWPQPPFYVHQMILDAPGQDFVVDAQVHGSAGDTSLRAAAESLNVLAAKSQSGDSIVLRVVNSGSAAVNVTISFPSAEGARSVVPSSYVLTTLAAPEGNPLTDISLSDPLRHSPVVSPRVPFDAKRWLLIPPVSFQIFVFTMSGEYMSA